MSGPAKSPAMHAGLAAIDALDLLQPPACLLEHATPEQRALMDRLVDEAKRRERVARLFKPEGSQ